MSKPSKLYLLTNVAEHDAVIIHDDAQLADGSMLYLLPDSRKSQGYTADGEIAFVGMDVLRGSGQLIDLKTLPNVGDNVESLALLSDSHIDYIELHKPVEASATFIFYNPPLSTPNSLIGYTSSELSPSSVSSMAKHVNNLLQQDATLEREHEPTLTLGAAKS